MLKPIHHRTCVEYRKDKIEKVIFVKPLYKIKQNMPCMTCNMLPSAVGWLMPGPGTHGNYEWQSTAIQTYATKLYNEYMYVKTGN